MDFIEKEKFEVKGNELDAKVNELRNNHPYLNVCMQRYAPTIYADANYELTIYHNNKCNTDVLVFRRKDK